MTPSICAYSVLAWGWGWRFLIAGKKRYYSGLFFSSWFWFHGTGISFFPKL